MDRVLSCLREFLDPIEQLRLRTVSRAYQQYKSYYIYRASSNVETEFRLTLRFVGPQVEILGEDFQVLWTRPLIERLVIIPNSHPLSLKLAYRHLQVVSHFFGDSVETAVRTLKSSIQIPLGTRGN